MTRRKVLSLLFVLAVLGTGLVRLLGSDLVGGYVCQRLPGLIPPGVPVELAVKRCTVDALDLGLRIEGVHVSVKGAPSLVLDLDRAFASVSVWTPFDWVVRKRIRVSDIELDRPRAAVDLGGMRTPNPSAPSGKPFLPCDLISAFDKVEVNRLNINQGDVEVVLPEGRHLSLRDLEVNEKSRSGLSTLRVSETGGELEVPGAKLPLERIQVSGQVNVPGDNLVLSRLEVRAGELSVLAHGSLRDFCDPEVSVDGTLAAPLDLAVALAQVKGLDARGMVSAHLALSGKIANPAIHADIDGADLDFKFQGNDVNPGDISASLDLHDDRLELSQLYWPIGEGYGRVSGHATLSGKIPVELQVEGKAIGFGELMNKLPVKHPWVDARASVKGRLQGQLLPTPTLAGPAEVELSDFVVRNRGWDEPAHDGDEILRIPRSRIETDFNFNPDRIHLTHTRVTTDRGEALAEALLYTDPRRGLDITAEIPSLDLEELKSIAGLPWAGIASATAHITGPYGKQIIDGRVAVKDLHFAGVEPGDVSAAIHFQDLTLAMNDATGKKGRTSYDAKGYLDFNGAPDAAGSLVIKEGHAEDLAEALHGVHWAFDLLRGNITGSVAGTIDLARGPVLAPTSDFHLTLADVELWQRPIGNAEFKMHTQNGDSITVPELVFQGPGTIRFGGHQQIGGELDYRLSFDQVPAMVLGHPELDSWELRGAMSGALWIHGPQQQVQINGEIRGAKQSIMGVPIGNGRVQVTDVGSTTGVKGSLGAELGIDMKLRWEAGVPFEAQLTLATQRLQKYFPTLPLDVAGELDGQLGIRGKLQDPGTYQGSLEIPTFKIQKGDLVAMNTEPIKLDIHGDTYDLRSLSVRGSNTELSISGSRRGPEKNLSLAVNGDADARLLELFPSTVESSAGHLSLAATISGTQEHPAVLGNLKLDHGRLKIRDYPLDFDELRALIEFSQSSVEIRGVTGKLNRGDAQLSGSMSMRSFLHVDPQAVDLQFQLKGGQFRVPESLVDVPDGLPLTVSGRVALQGAADLPVLSGVLSIDRLKYARDWDIQSVLANTKKQEAKPSGKAKPHVRFSDLQIQMAGDVKIENNFLKAAGRGVLLVNGDDAHPLLRGEIEGVDGGRAYFRGNEFQIDRLRFEFKGGQSLIPDLDVHATTTTRDYQVYLHFWGPADHFQYDLSSQPGLSREDIVSLLTLGITSQDRGGNAAAALGGTLVGIFDLDDQVKHFIPKNPYLRDPQVQLTTTYLESLGTMEPTAELSAKLLTDRLTVRVQQPFVGRGSKAQAQFKLTDRFSVQGQVDDDNSEYTVPDLGFDLKLRYEIK